MLFNPAANSRSALLSRNPGKHPDLADEGVEVDLNQPETLKAAFEEAHGVISTVSRKNSYMIIVREINKLRMSTPQKGMSNENRK